MEFISEETMAQELKQLAYYHARDGTEVHSQACLIAKPVLLNTKLYCISLIFLLSSKVDFIHDSSYCEL